MTEDFEIEMATKIDQALLKQAKQFRGSPPKSKYDEMLKYSATKRNNYRSLMTEAEMENETAENKFETTITVEDFEVINESYDYGDRLNNTINLEHFVNLN